MQIQGRKRGIEKRNERKTSKEVLEKADKET